MQAAPKPKTLNQQAFEAADRVHSAAIHLLRGLRIRDRESGIGPAQLSALSVLVFAGPKSLAELAQSEQVKPPTMSRVVAGLVRTKLVRMVTNDKDRRAVVIIPTSKGIALMQKARLRRVESLARAVDALEAAEVALLRNAAEMIEKLSRVV
jgi:DNA-binding MarR family transcriptional regulator